MENNQPAAEMQTSDENSDKAEETEESFSNSDSTLNETIIPSNTNQILEQNDGTVDLNPNENISSNNSCKNASINETVTPVQAQNCRNDSSRIIISSSTLNPRVVLSKITNLTNVNFVTEEEIAESLKKKEENDSLSLTGSYLSGSISQISGSFKTSKFDISLDALMAKKNELIDSIKSVLANSSDANIDAKMNEEKLNDPNVSIVSDGCLDQKAGIIETSTPFPKSKPPAARFLKKWKPTFLNDEFQVIDEINTFDEEEEEEEDGYEKAMASLKEVLNNTAADTASKLNSYSNMLDAFKEEDDKKYDSMMLTITSEKCSLEDAIKEVDEFIEEFSEKNIGQENEHTVITIDSRDTTLVSSEQVNSVPDNVLPSIVPEKGSNTVITINSSQSENEVTVANDQIPTKTVDTPNNQVSESENKDTQVVVNENKPKENDPDILIIGGDDDIDINVDDEDLLLASDEEGKEKKTEMKKIQPQVPLVKDLEVFVSSDPNENKDNNDPKWDYLRNLGSDFEKYKAVRGRWRNIGIPNPKKDLTCRCRKPALQFNGDPPIRNNCNDRNEVRTSKKRPHSPENLYKSSKRQRRESCTMLFDMSIDQLANDVHNARIDIMRDQDQALHELAEIQQIEKMITMQKSGSKADMQRLEARHITETRNCLEEFRKRMNETMDAAQAQLIALRKASDEVKQFHEFYPIEEGAHNDKDSLVLLNEAEVEEILEVEKMIMSFPSFYTA